jgi:uncharacterized protein YndB with AHSA1/START domain
MQKLEENARQGRINEEASMKDRQSVIINAPIERVWDVLTNLNEWPFWNREIKNISCEKVAVGAPFDWTIRHTKLNSNFQVVEKPTILAFTGKGKFTKTIFVWELEPSDQQTIITVEQSVEGIVLPILSNQSRLHDVLVDWLSRLKEKSEE